MADLRELLAFRPPFDFAKTLAFHRRRPGDEVDLVQNGVYLRLLQTPFGLITLRLSKADDLHVRLEAFGKGAAAARSWLRARVARFLFTDLDLAPFYAKLRRFEAVSHLERDLHGLHPLASLEPFEAVIFALLGQQVSLTQAIARKTLLARRFGRSLCHEGQKLISLPTAQTLSGLEPGELATIGLPRRRAVWLVGLAQAAVSGNLDLEALAACGGAEAVASLTAHPGVGPWTAEMIRLRGLGCLEAFPAADLGLQAAFRQCLKGARDPGPQVRRIGALAASFGAYQGLLATYLWASLWPPEAFAAAGG